MFGHLSAISILSAKILLPHSLNTIHALQTLRKSLNKCPPNLLNLMSTHTHILKTRRPLILKPTRHNPIKPPQVRTNIQSHPMTTNIPPQMHTHRANLSVLIHPHARVLCSSRVDTVVLAGFHDGVFKQMHPTARTKTMSLQIQDGISGQLPRAVEGRLAAAERFVKLGTAVGAEEGLLGGSDGA